MSRSGEFALGTVEVDVAQRVSALYRRHRDGVYRLALRYGGDASWAEDVTQDVFVSLCRHIHRLHELEELEGWFYRVTHNHCLSRLRRRAVATAPGVRWLLRRRSEQAGDLERDATLRQGVRQVLGMVDAMPPKQRLAFCMYHLDGKELAEIGEILGHSKSYVCKLIKRAEARVRGVQEEVHGG